MDGKDVLLLNLLQQDARQTLERLADEVALSVPAVQKRIKRLRDTGVIIKEVAVVDPAAVNITMKFIIVVELERDRSDQVEAFQRKAVADPLVQQCYYVTGEGDFIIVSVARNMYDYEAMTQRLFFSDDNVRGFKTFISMGEAYQTLGITIEG